MRILGIDTATGATAVAILDTDSGEAVQRRDDPPPGERPRHTVALMALVVSALEACGADWDQLDLIAVGVGPGTFTGIRIGVATARALAAARGIPIVGVSTLRALALGAGSAAAAARRDPLALLDARRGEAFVAGWSVEGLGPRQGGRPAGESPPDEPLVVPRAAAPEQLAQTLAEAGRRWLAVGDGAIKFRDVLERCGARVPEDRSELHRVSAIDHCRLASGLPAQNPNQVLPQYLREPDAELNLRAAQSKAIS